MHTEAPSYFPGPDSIEPTGDIANLPAFAYCGDIYPEPINPQQPEPSSSPVLPTFTPQQS